MVVLEKVDIKLLRHFAYEFQKLQVISKKLHRQDENACNYGLTPRQEARVKNLMESAQKIASNCGKGKGRWQE